MEREILYPIYPSFNICMTEAQLRREQYKKTNKIMCVEAKENSALLEITAKQRATRHTLIDLVRHYNNLNDTSKTYTEFRVPKHSGGYRTIEAPHEDLKIVQKNISKALTGTGNVLCHNAAHGFIKYRNTKTALKVHQDNKSRWFLKVDIKDFFGSTTANMLTQELDYNGVMRKLLRNVELAPIACNSKGVLPQGSPLSPLLANLTMLGADEELTNRMPELTYTRYADDMLFSSKTAFDKDKVVQIIKDVFKDLNLGYEINNRKTRYGSFSGRNWNLGLMYNNKYQITVGAKNKKLIKNRIHNWKTKQEGKEKETIVAEMYSINGILGYYKYIEPKYFKDFKLLKETDIITPVI